MNSEGVSTFIGRVTARQKIRNMLQVLHRRQAEHRKDHTTPVYGDVTPFPIGRVEKRMRKFAQENDIELATSSLYLSEERLLHSIREPKQKVGKVVSDKDIIDFPANRYKMNLYYDTHAKNFIYQQGTNKFVVEPSREVKLPNGKVRKVMIVTIDKMKGTSHFNESKYIKIK
ncbi:MAG: hypothetical protein IJ776_09295 [Paludibacteraceae bacterium]|nr:hypothetical protein [Paludibacteraceae bacterium]